MNGDEIIRAVSADGFVKISAVSARGVVQRAREIHGTSPVATAALGRTLCAASILGDFLKEDEASVTVRINGGGPIGSIICVSDSAGNVRGYVQNPWIDLPKRPDGKLAVGAAVGRDGLLTVSRDFGAGEPYIGSTELVSGEIAEDFTRYFAESEQVGAACGLGVLMDTDLSVLAAGGYVVQLLPGAPEEAADRLEVNIRDTGAVTDVLRSRTAMELVSGLLGGLGYKALSRSPVEYRCYCSRERVLEAVLSMGETELREIVAKGGDTEASCQFCDRVYRFGPGEVAELLDKADGGDWGGKNPSER